AFSRCRTCRPSRNFPTPAYVGSLLVDRSRTQPSAPSPKPDANCSNKARTAIGIAARSDGPRRGRRSLVRPRDAARPRSYSDRRHMGRTTMARARALVVVLLVSTSVVISVASANPAAAAAGAITVTVDPSTNLADGQPITITATGFEPGESV